MKFIYKKIAFYYLINYFKKYVYILFNYFILKFYFNI